MFPLRCGLLRLKKSNHKCVLILIIVLMQQKSYIVWESILNVV